MINESFDAMDTPNKKRKRDNFSRFVSSTPIKLANKENFLFSDSMCMEHKSIADIVAERNASKLQQTNDFEVIRKPPKKKKKSAEESCFVNPCLDLQVQEKSINPFEVVRSDNTEAIMLAQGVANEALDIAVNTEAHEVPKTVATNPFEVIRESELAQTVVKGIDNTALEVNPPARTPLMMPLPFTPTVNHRIDFSNMPDNLTPSALLSTKLILESDEEAKTPKKNVTVKSRKSLSVISEEAEIDISEELDNYQLQLENSINEAKMQNRKYVFDTPKTIMEENENEEEVQQEEDDDEKTGAPVVNNATYTKELSRVNEETTTHVEFHVSVTETHATTFSSVKSAMKKESSVDDEPYLDENNEDVQFEEVDSFEDDFGKLGQFKRAYRTEAPAVFKRPNVKTQHDSQPKKMNLGGSIRRSIRRLINPKTDNTEKSSEESTENEKPEGIFQSIRHSLRRKAKPKTIPVNLDNSVIGRTVFSEKSNEDSSKKTLQRPTLKRHVVKTMKTFMENVEAFDHY